MVLVEGHWSCLFSMLRREADGGLLIVADVTFERGAARVIVSSC